MSLITNVGRVANALRLYKQYQTMYVGLGNSTAEWDNPKLPTPEVPTQSTLPGLLGMKKVTTTSLARLADSTTPTTAKTVLFGNRKFELVAVADAPARDGFYLYVEAKFEPTDFTSGTYRSVGLFTNPVFKDGVTGAVVPAGEITNQGTLEMYENRQAMSLGTATITQQFMIKG